MDRRVFLVAGTAGVLGAGGWWAMRPSVPGTSLPGMAEAQTAEGEPDFARVPDMAMGAEDAPVTVVEYGSLTCPHCATFAQNVLPQLKENYIDPGHVRFIHREVYFDRYGLWGAMVARCGDASRYFPMIDMLYEEQRTWAGSNDPAVVADNLRALARRSGLTDAEVNACLEDGEQAQAMVGVYQHHATEDGIQSTPSFIIDGERHSNMSYEEFAAILDAKLGN